MNPMFRTGGAAKGPMQLRDRSRPPSSLPPIGERFAQFAGRRPSPLSSGVRGGYSGFGGGGGLGGGIGGRGIGGGGFGAGIGDDDDGGGLDGVAEYKSAPPALEGQPGSKTCPFR